MNNQMPSDYSPIRTLDEWTNFRQGACYYFLFVMFYFKPKLSWAQQWNCKELFVKFCVLYNSKFSILLHAARWKQWICAVHKFVCSTHWSISPIYIFRLLPLQTASPCFRIKQQIFLNRVNICCQILKAHKQSALFTTW